MAIEQRRDGVYGHGDSPVQIPDTTSIKLPWWTAMAAIVTRRAGGFKPVLNSLNRVSRGVADHSSQLMAAGRRMGLRFFPKGGRWNIPRVK